MKVSDYPADLALKLARLWHEAEESRARGGESAFWSGRQSLIEALAKSEGIESLFLSARDGNRGALST